MPKKNNPRPRKNDVKVIAGKAVRRGKTAEHNTTAKLVKEAADQAEVRGAAAKSVVKKTDRPAAKPGAKKRKFARVKPAAGPIDKKKAEATQAKGAAKAAKLPEPSPKPTKAERQEGNRKFAVKKAADNLREASRQVRIARGEVGSAEGAPRHADVLAELKDRLHSTYARAMGIKVTSKEFPGKFPTDKQVEALKAKLANDVKTLSKKREDGASLSPSEGAASYLENLTKHHDEYKAHIAIGAEKFDGDRQKNIEGAKKGLELALSKEKDASDIRGNADRIAGEEDKRDADIEVAARKKRAADKAAANDPVVKMTKFADGYIKDHRGKEVQRWKFLKFPSVSAMVNDRKEGEAHQDFMARHSAAITTRINQLAERAAKRKTPNRGSRPTFVGTNPATGERVSRPLRDAGNKPVKVVKKGDAQKLREKMAERNATPQPAPGEVKSKQISDAISKLSGTENPFK